MSAVDRSKQSQRHNAKSLDEQRKFGLAPLAVDAATGRDINPHLPAALTSVPWYFGSGVSTLSHHNKTDPAATPAAVSAAAAAQQPAKPSLVPLRCITCGKDGHVARDCFNRLAVKTTTAAVEAASDIANDAVVAAAAAARARVQAASASHARGNSTKPVRRARAADALLNMLADEEGQGAAAARPANSADPSSANTATTTTTARKALDALAVVASTTCNPHRAQDTASAVPKYLISLDAGAAFFDPKSRTMNAAPAPAGGSAGSAASSYQGDRARAETKSAMETIATMRRVAGV